MKMNIYRTAAGTWQHSGALCPIYEFSYTNITNSDIRLIHSTIVHRYIIYAIRGVIQIECTPVASTNSRDCRPSFKFLGELLGSPINDRTIEASKEVESEIT